MHESIITAARNALHERLVSSGPLSIELKEKNGKKIEVASNADISQPTSRSISLHIAKNLNAHTTTKGPGQTAGKKFEVAIARFLEATMPHLDAVRPGPWHISNVGGSRNIDHLAQHEPYRHLDELAKEVEKQRELLSVLGNSYAISPDILVTRDAATDDRLNEDVWLVDEHSATLSPFRERNTPPSLPAPQFVHAVVSCKWTMRSDRAQNTRAEALNLIRNRKGRAPHIVAVTAEPSPSRIASLALGTGDIDMVYHFALHELQESINEIGNDEASSMLSVLIESERLRDISDLPIDLAV